MARLRVALALSIFADSLDVPGYGHVSLVPNGWPDETAPYAWVSGSEVVAPMGSRTYFADRCTAGNYSNEQYLSLNLLGKTMRYTVDLSGAGCGCNAALYMVSMRQNQQMGECGNDYYCDANSVCGVACAEIDTMEANTRAFHATLHARDDHAGVGRGYGGGGSNWDGPRDWGKEDYGPGGRCVDTSRAFDVAVSFPTDSQGQAWGVKVELSQEGKPCPLTATVAGYERMGELNSALQAGMTPVVSYWKDDDMLWLDGAGGDGQGACPEDRPEDCGPSVSFSNFRVDTIDAWVDPASRPTQPPLPAGVVQVDPPTAAPANPPAAQPAAAQPWRWVEPAERGDSVLLRVKAPVIPGGMGEGGAVEVVFEGRSYRGTVVEVALSPALREQASGASPTRISDGQPGASPVTAFWVLTGLVSVVGSLVLGCGLYAHVARRRSINSMAVLAMLQNACERMTADLEVASVFSRQRSLGFSWSAPRAGSQVHQLGTPRDSVPASPSQGQLLPA